MPVQINEMVIKANILEGSEGASNTHTSSGSADVDREEIIRECAALVLEILNSKNQR